MKWIFFIFICLFFSCGNCHQKKFANAIAYVDSTQHKYWGNGYYRLLVFYTFNVNNKVVKGMYKPKYKLEYKYTASYVQGDSVLVRYNIDNLEENEIIKIKKKKKRLIRIL